MSIEHTTLRRKRVDLHPPCLSGVSLVKGAMKFFASVFPTLAVFLALAGFSRMEAASPVWKVSGPEGGTLYLGGSVHALRSSDYPLPPAFDRAFAESERIVFEAGEESAASRKVLKSGEYPRNDSLKNHVDPRTYVYVRKVFTLLGVPESKFARYRPWVLTLMLTSPSLRGLSGDLGVEGHLKKRARVNKKPISGLVPLQEHLNVFTGLNDRQSEAVLLLTFIPNASGSYSNMVDAWRKGDVEFLWRKVRAAYADYPAFGERLIEARNRAWLPRIESYLRSGQTCFVVVGAGHMGGPEGLLALLRNRGHQVDQL